MTIEEFIEKLNQMKSFPSWERNKHQIVKVRLNDPSMGPVSQTTVTGVGFGFDWEANSFLIFCEDKIYKNKDIYKFDDLTK